MLHMSQTPPNLIRRSDASRDFGISPSTLTRWLASGRIAKYADGRGGVYVDADEIRDLLTPRVAS